MQKSLRPQEKSGLIQLTNGAMIGTNDTDDIRIALDHKRRSRGEKSRRTQGRTNGLTDGRTQTQHPRPNCQKESSENGSRFLKPSEESRLVSLHLIGFEWREVRRKLWKILRNLLLWSFPCISSTSCSDKKGREMLAVFS